MVGNGDNWLGFLSKPPRMQNSTEPATLLPIHWPSHPFLKDALPLHGNDLRARLRNALCGDAKEIPCKAALRHLPAWHNRLQMSHDPFRS